MIRAALFAFAVCACGQSNHPGPGASNGDGTSGGFTSGLDETSICPSGEAACSRAPKAAMLRPVGGVVRHWSLETECIRTTVHPDLLAVEGSALDGITSAVSVWRDLACNRLCVLDPEISAEPLDTDCIYPSSCEPRIHFRAMAPDEASPYVVHTTDPCTGVIHAVGLQFNARWLQDGPGTYGVVAQALGLQYAEGVDSILGEYAGITSADMEAICTLYGTPAWCEAP